MGQLVQQGSEWIWQGTYAERHIPKSAGCRWDPARRVWYTERAAVAAALAEYAEGDAATQLTATIAASRAQDAEIDIPCPDGLAYRPFQKAGIAWILARPASLVGDQMGLGKTIQAIGAINATTVQRVLIVCPLSVKLNWAAELRTWITRNLTVGLADVRTLPNTDIVLIHPEALVRHAAALAEIEWDLVTVDEGHQFKNPSAKRTKALHGIRAARRVVLTGTPIPNRPEEIWSLLHWLDPAAWPRFVKFQARYGSIQGAPLAWRLEELQAALRSTVMIRRLKADVLTELPPKVRQVVTVDPAGSASLQEALLHEAEVQAQIAELRARAAEQLGAEGAAKESAEYTSAALALREAERLELSEISRVRHETALAKVPAVLEHARAVLAETDKIAIWAHHHDVIDALVEGLGEYGVVWVDGRCNPEARDQAVHAFQEDQSVRVWVGGMSAAGVGITLTATSYAIFAEQDWVPATLSQAEDRHHRIGQLDSVLVQHLVVDGSIDAKMIQTTVRKQDIADRALDRPAPVKEPEVTMATLRAAKVQEGARRVQADQSRPLTPRQQQNLEIAQRLSQEDVAEIHQALRTLAAMDTDRARYINGAGFSKFDSQLGTSLAESPALSPKQAALGLQIAHKYRGQIGELAAAAKLADPVSV